MIQTIKLPIGIGELCEIFAFYCCVHCDLADREQLLRHGLGAFLFNASIKHYCDDCGQELVQLEGIPSARARRR